MTINLGKTINTHNNEQITINFLFETKQFTPSGNGVR